MRENLSSQPKEDFLPTCNFYMHMCEGHFCKYLVDSLRLPIREQEDLNTLNLGIKESMVFWRTQDIPPPTGAS